MKNLREHLHHYLTMRRALGFKLFLAGKALIKFIDFAEENHAQYVSTSLALRWAQQPADAQPATWAGRLRYVRGFAQYMSAIDPRTEVPPYELLPHPPKRARPHIYTNAEIENLMTEALRLPICTDWVEASSLKRQTFYHLIGLLAVTGMRISEATNLKMDSINFESGLLTIVGTKFGKSRVVPLHESTVRALATYKELRNKYKQSKKSNFFFVNMRGNQLDQGTVRKTFYWLSRNTGLRGENSSTGPRIHDLRHRFAVHTLLHWYQTGIDAERMLPVLATYLGHVHVNDTYWYLTAFPELMGSVVERLEQRWGDIHD